MKLFGIMLLFLSCVGCGFLRASFERERLRAAEDFSRLVLNIKTDIRYSHKTLFELFSKIASSTSSAAVKKLCGVLAGPQGLTEVLQKNLKEISADGEVKTAMSVLLGALGTTDLEGQLTLCDMTKEKIDEALKRIREEAVKKAKLYQSLFALLGIALSILLC